jgi:hypothetical protein
MLAARMQMFLSLQKNNFRSGKYIQGFTDRVKTISKFNKTPSVHENWHKLSGLSKCIAN